MTTKFRFFNVLLAITIALGLVFTASPPMPSNALPEAVNLGGVVVIGFVTDDPDTITFLALENLAEGEVIRFTDNGWYASGSFRTTEGAVSYTVPSGGIPAGTVVTKAATFNTTPWSIDSTGFGGSLAFSTAGDQIIVFQGDASTPTLLHAVNGDGTTPTNGWQSDATSANTSALPTGLIEGTTAVGLFQSVTETDNAHYNCAMGSSGTKEELLALINNRANWSTSNDPYGTYAPWDGCPATFTVTQGDDAPEVTDHTPGIDASDIALDANIEITFSEAVTLDSGFATIACTNSGNHDYAVDESGDPLIVLTPSEPFETEESCTVTLTPTAVHDDDVIDPPDTMADVYSWSFTTVAAGEADALIYVQENTDLTGTSLDLLTATFPATIPQVIVDLPYQINSRMTLAEELPAGTTVTIYVTTESGGPFLYAENAVIPGQTFWITDLVGGTPADFDAGYGGHWETYNITVTGPGTNAFDIDTTVTIESIISKDGFVSEVILDSISLPVHIDADEDAALAYAQVNTTITGATLAEITATFPDVIPPILADLDYHINSRMTLTEALPAGATITITISVNGSPETPYVTDVPVPGTTFWITELFDPEPDPALFDDSYDGRVEVYHVTVTGGSGDPLLIGTDVLIESIISKDDFITPVVLDDISLPVYEDADLAYVQANTTLSGTLAALTATFPPVIPQVIVDLPYQINSRMTLAAPLPAGTTVTIYITTKSGGPYLYADNVVIPGQTFWVTDLVGGTPANFDAGYGGYWEFYEITLDTGGVAVDTTVTIESIISKDSFSNLVVLDSITLPVLLDGAPAVSAVSPLNAATGVALDANLTVTFNEPVDVADSWYDITCVNSGTHTAVVSGGPTTFTLNPDINFAGETCTVTLESTLITDQDTIEPYDQMAEDYSWSFTTTFCGAPHTPISGVQGSGTTSPLLGSVVVVEGIVTADLQGSSPGMNGFYIQSLTTNEDADPLTSEGIMIYDNTIPASLGDILRIQGTVTEYQNLTEIGSASLIEVCSTGNALPSAVVVDLPDIADESFTLEPYEGMLVSIPETLTVQQNYFQARYGQVTLGAGGRIAQMHNLGKDVGSLYEYTRMIILDDANTRQNVNPTAYYGVDDFMRAGDTITGGVTGIIDQGAINSYSGVAFPYNYYRLQPNMVPSFTRENPRPTTPSDVGGTLKVVGFNTLNYFTTLDMAPYRTTPPYDGTNTPRGADSAAEFTRQQDKLVAALAAMDADVYGLLELESWDTAAAPQALVTALNTYLAGSATYAVVPDPVLGHFDILTDTASDDIQVGLIYKTDTVSLVGDSLSVDDTIFDRSPFAQEFEEIATGEQFVVVANHFKSKGSCPDDGSLDEDQGDGQGCWNARRVLQAEAMLDFIDTTLAPLDPDVMVIGELNAYGDEDPIQTLVDGGLINQIAAFVPEEERYSYVYDGTAGYLDHFLSTANMTFQLSGVDFFHINADEISFIDYNTEYKGGSYSPDLYLPHMYRSSDHDPVVVGLKLGAYQYWMPIIGKQ
ncbi:MAG: ExeM/NucH family extracellular endonuclease [Anaerolineaceae bacterium]|nr:ExeM/NucH family extracellular endonuclease [Anaerolineaceae bacterium]